MKTNLNLIKRFDAFSKPLEDFRIKTASGAFVTIISTIVILILFLLEVRYFLTVDMTQELFVDVTRGQKLKINIDIVFPRLSCGFLGLDAMDVSGEQQIDIDHDIYKYRLDLDGNQISEASKHDVAPPNKKMSNDTQVEKVKPTCGSCYGAESAQRKCCQTCDEVRDAYREKGWSFTNPESIEQCKNEGWSEKIKEAANEGCRFKGHLYVNKVAGNFHFAPGKSFTQSHVHVHDIKSFGRMQYNISHNIVHLSFGDSYPGITNILDGRNVSIDQLSQMFTYFVKVVPTTYVNLDGTKVESNQFSVTKHMKPTALSGGTDGLPGVFFSYEINSMMVKITETRRSFITFLTSICAIIGGVYTGIDFSIASKKYPIRRIKILPHQTLIVSSLIDAFIYNSSKIIREKIAVGKAS